MTDTSPNLITINVEDVMFVIHRDRDRETFNREVKEPIRQMGVRIPLKVRDISHWPRERRQRPHGGLYKWQAFYGEGRSLAVTELAKETGDRSWLQVPALLDNKASESEIAVAFLTENISRSDLSWMELGQLLRGDAEALEAKRGGKLTKADVKTLAKAYFVGEGHVLKMLRVLQKLSPALEKELKGVTLQDAEALTSLPAKGQEIVIETMAEEGLSQSDVAAVVRRARRAVESDQPLSKTALKAELRRVREDLDRERKTAKPLRLHHSLGPENVMALLARPDFRKAIDKEGINYKRFEAAVEEGRK